MTGLEVAANVGFSLDDVGRKVTEVLNGRRRPRPIQRPLIGVSDPGAGAGNPTVCRVGGTGHDGPASGKTWDIRNLCVVGADDHTTGAFPGALYVGNTSGLSLNDFGIASVRDTIPQVPFSETYSGGEVKVTHGDGIFVVLWSVTANLQYTVTVLVDEWDTDEYLATVI